MKYFIYLCLIVFFSCNNNSQTEKIITTDSASSVTIHPPENNEPAINDISWSGTLNGKTPVFVHYRTDGDIITGEIIYLNTKDKIPVKLIGTVEEDKSYRILEFERRGNISGIITGTPSGNNFSGNWFSPKTRKELIMSLNKKDTAISSPDPQAPMQEIYGSYRYQYSEAGNQGGLELKKLAGSKAGFSVNAVTGEPARNIADVNEDTINLNATHFIYKVPDADRCAFEVSFYKGFVRIKYTDGNCEGQFGHNATVEGIFLKVK